MASENVETAFEEGGRNPPDANLYHIAKDVLHFLNGFQYLHDTKKQILGEITFEKHHEHWSADAIKEAFNVTKKPGQKDQDHWAFVITAQVLKYLICDECKENQKLELRSNVKRKCGLGSNEKAKCRKEHPEDIFSQSTAEQSTTRPAEGDEQHSGGNQQTSSSGQTYIGGNNKRSQTIYIRVPFLEMIPNEQHKGEREVQNVISDYKLIAGLPGSPVISEIRKRISYVMSFNHQTRNANWVYEILNRDTLAKNPVELNTSEHPYHKGHLAAAANHRWCCEARDDANMIDNIVPQHKNLNAILWKSSEDCCRTRASNQNNIRNIHVYSGPVYLRDMVPPWIQGKRVPSDFFKVIIEENVDGTVDPPRYYLFPNQDLRRPPGQDNDNVERYRMTTDRVTGNTRDITIDDIQRDSGLTFIDIGPNAEAREITGTLHGKDGNAVPRTAEIQVTICN